ncbi:MAG: hypothetical protein OXI13_12605 [Gammaproteobacteria bacterium]|nr:hypothetical protein [Gammaproteobacteria bacterium]MYA65817.1 hypothetical protein [Gammaproteobacteria bacterium]MYH47454.1 hypothetical protein [Gammaproteobacteria bacterium]MYL12362.1 hypothetical protein [Gammaproteobacteria bacterium]
MQARDILDTTHQLEEKGMARPQADTTSEAPNKKQDPKVTEEQPSEWVAMMFERINKQLDSVVILFFCAFFGGLLAIALSVLLGVYA